MKRIIVKNISKSFRIGVQKNQSVLARTASLFSGREPKRELHVLKDISFEAHAGEIIGIIGSNGAGKTTLLQIIAGILEPDSGSVETLGKIVSLIGLRMGLQPRLNASENIYLCASLFGLSQKEIKERINSIIQFAELENFVNTKLHQFSSGMAQRLAFSVAMHCDPEILLLDEVFEVGDKDFRAKSSCHIQKLAEKGVVVFLVTHELPMIEKYCHRVLWLDNGTVVAKGKPKEVVGKYTTEKVVETY